MRHESSAIWQGGTVAAIHAARQESDLEFGPGMTEVMADAGGAEHLVLCYIPVPHIFHLGEGRCVLHMSHCKHISPKKRASVSSRTGAFNNSNSCPFVGAHVL